MRKFKSKNQAKTIALLLCCLVGYATAGYGQATNNTDRFDFSLQWEFSTLPVSAFSVVYDRLERPYFYATAKAGGLLVFDASDPQAPVLVKTIPISALESLHVMNAFQQGNALYLALGGHFGGQSELGMAIIDIGDPPNAAVLDVWRSAPGKGSAIVVVEGDYAYLGAMTLGVMIFDVSNKSDIQQIAQFVPDIDFPRPNPTNLETFNARGMALRDEKLYLCYDAGGLRVIDVGDKANPRELGRYINEAVGNKPHAYNNIALNGNLAYIPVDYCGLEVIDISDPANMTQVGWWNPWECEGLGNIWFNSPGHTNEVVFVESRDLVFLSAADSELSVLDVADPARPRLVGGFGEPGNSQGTWGG